MLRGKLNQNKVDKHYNFLNKMLKVLKEKYKKEIVVCIHPKDNLEIKKKIFSNFDVVKFKTREKIINAFIVIFLNQVRS